MENTTIGKVLFTGGTDSDKERRSSGRQICRRTMRARKFIWSERSEGAVLWMGDLMKHITNDAQIDFVVASSYGTGTTTSGVVKSQEGSGRRYLRQERDHH